MSLIFEDHEDCAFVESAFGPNYKVKFLPGIEVFWVEHVTGRGLGISLWTVNENREAFLYGVENHWKPMLAASMN